MNNFDVDLDVQSVDQRLRSLARELPVDSAHKQLLRNQLLRRHGELLTKSHSGGLLSRLQRMRRLTLVAPAALSAAVIAGLVIVGLQVSGQQHAQPADAQRLSEAAVVRTVPTITGWRATVTRYRSNSTDASVAPFSFPKNVWCYIAKYNGKPYPMLYVRNYAKAVPTKWQWAFVQLPTALVEKRTQVLSAHKVIDGTAALGVRFALTHGNAVDRVEATAWVDVSTGRILSLERQVFKNGSLTEDDWAQYQYSGLNR